jgi:predicted adenylyl cyclase CyaB
MPTNVEIKAKTREFERLRGLLEHISDTPCEATSQEDTFFSTARGRLKLRVTHPGGSSLIFYEREDSPGPKPSSYMVYPVADPGRLRAVLAACLGVRGVVRKQRRLYMIGNTRVHLDDVEGLGTFVELEVMLRDGESADAGMVVARGLMARLGIEEGDLVKGAYMDLLQAHP